MLVPLKWLREFVDHGLEADELAQVLTMAGLEVDGIEERHQGLAQVVTARVLAVEPHPGADRLRLARVETGQGEAVIVCGAPNLREGMVGALALPGAVLGEITVKKAKIRGVESLGMLCSLRELGISDDHSGIAELDSGLEPGLPLVEALDLETQVMEISITPNRGDALSMLGVARDLAALTGRPLTLPQVVLEEHQPPMEQEARITISDPEGCPRYAARLVREVEIGPSPVWMADRLMAAGIRPINNVVDVTNYVLMERGQPLHAFDFRRLSGGRIDVRRARAGERFTTLDGQERELEEGMLLICDGERPVALAGVMGGLNSEIEPDTREVLIESAFFDPISIRRTSKRLGLSTEAAYRFERGIDRQGCLAAADRAAQLMAQLAGGKVAAGFLDIYPRPYQAPRLTLSVKRTAAFLGLELEPDQVARRLRSLGLAVEHQPGQDQMVVEPPAFRTDLERPVDLTEEVARLVGYDRIPASPPLAPLSARPRAWNQRVRERARDLMAAQGFDEAISMSFAHPEAVEEMALAPEDPRRRVVKLMNPLSEDQSVLRTSLLPGLLAAAGRNLRHRVNRVALFEVGKVFWDRPGEKQPREPSRLMGILCGLAEPVAWWTGEKPVSLAHARGAVEYLLEGLGLKEVGFPIQEGFSPYLDPAQCCLVCQGDKRLGELGRLRDKLARAYDIDKPVFVFELDLDLLVELASDKKTYRPLPRYPEVVRDVALVVDHRVPAGEVLEAAGRPGRKKARRWLQAVELFDLYQGKPLPKGKKSLGLRFHYRSERRTLTEDEVIPEHQAIVQNLLERFQGTLRQ